MAMILVNVSSLIGNSTMKFFSRLMFAGFLMSVSMLSAALELMGPLTQGGLIYGQVEPGTEVKLNGEAVKTSVNGIFVFGFGRDAELEHSVSLVSPEGSKSEYPISLKKREYRIQYIEGIPKKIMSPSEEALVRIRSESKQVRSARNINSDRLDFLAPIVWPLKGPITGVYGSQRFYNGEPKRPHYGLDIAAPVGATVTAPLPGVVTLTHNDMFYSGGTLVVDHGHGISSTFIHLSKVLVKVGDEIKTGQPIAEVGAGGRATGPHLDWRMNWFGHRLDPELLLPAR